MARNRPDDPRVFCIGWHKTGTSTLGLALIKLGYSVLGCRLDMVHPLRLGEVDPVLDVGGQYDALQDVPWAALYQELDERYPGSKFILTERDETDWLESASRHFGSTEIPLHQWLYGQGRLAGNEELYLQRYRQHNVAVRQYFRGRDESFLTMNLSRGDGWSELCEFLGQPWPSCSFPHSNKSPAKFNASERLLHNLREATPRAMRRFVFDLRQWVRDKKGLPDPRNRFNNFRENRRERAAWKIDSQ